MGQINNAKIKNKNIRKKFLKIKYSECFSSPLIRCKQTSELLIKKKLIKYSNDLMEINYGDFENLNYKILTKSYPKFISKWNKKLDPRFPNGENTLDVFKRLINFLDKNIKNKTFKTDSNILIITHNVVLRCLLGHYFKISRENWYKINVEYLDDLIFIKSNKIIFSNIERVKFLNIFKNFYYKWLI